MTDAPGSHGPPSAGSAPPVRVLFLVAHSTIQGPLPKIAPLLSAGLRQAGLCVEESGWSRRREGERLHEKILGRLSDLRRALRLLRRGHFDVLLVTTTHDKLALLRDFVLMLLGRSRVSGVVLHFHGSMVDTLLGGGHRLFRSATRWLVERAAAVLLLSAEEVEKWRRFAPAVAFCRVVNPFVPPPQAGLPAPARPVDSVPVILFVGRLIREKGVFDLIAAHASLCSESPCRLVIAGAGALDEVRAAIRSAGCPAEVDVVGYVNSEGLYELYRGADVFALPTYFGEGFPTVLTEAMAFGLPLVTTRIRGAADLLAEGDNALFVPARDQTALVAALRCLVEDPTQRARMGAANRRRVEDFAPEKVVPRYVEIITAAAERR